jgi:hypothetical protein
MPFSLNDIHSVGEILAFAARTEIMPRFRQLTPAQVRRKSSTFDLVTERWLAPASRSGRIQRPFLLRHKRSAYPF